MSWLARLRRKLGGWLGWECRHVTRSKWAGLVNQVTVYRVGGTLTAIAVLIAVTAVALAEQWPPLPLVPLVVALVYGVAALVLEVKRRGK